MKILRLLLTGLALTIALVVFLFVVAISPVAQTWFGQWALSRQPGLHGTFETLSIGWSHLDVTNLRIEGARGVLTAPALRVDFPLWTALRERRILVRGLVAKGWTLDLSHPAGPTGPTADSADGARSVPPATNLPSAATAEANAFRGLMSGWKLPWDESLDGVELEGDVTVAVPAGAIPTHLHVVITGGGVGAGREANLAFEVSALDLRLPGNAATARGRALVKINSARVIDRVELKSELVGKTGATPSDPAWSLDLAVAREASDEIYRLDLRRGPRPLAQLNAHWSAATGALGGTWKLDGQDSDVAPFAPDLAWPTFAVAGEGQFATDAQFASAHVTGRLETSVSRLQVLTPQFANVGALTLAAHFDVTRNGHSIHCDQLDLALSALQPVATARALQPFDVDERSGEIKVTDPQADWLNGSLQSLPLTWLAGLPNAFAVTAGEATATLLIRSVEGGFAVRSVTPVVATRVSIAQGERTIASAVDLSFALATSYGPQGGKLALTPLAIDHGGRRLATIELNATRPPGANQTTTLSGKWDADVAAIAAQAALPGLSARSASGDLSGTLSTYADLLTHATVVGHDPSHTLAATIRADLYADGTVAIVAPMKIALGRDIAELKVDLNGRAGPKANRAELNLASQNVSLAHLRLLAAPMAALSGIADRQAMDGERDKVPFWGNWRGNVTVAFERLRTDEDEFVDVGGRLSLEPDSIRLDGGHGGLPKQNSAQVEGTLTFAPDAESPYRLQATAAFSDFDATPFFASEKKDAEPMLEGRFSVAGTVSSQGRNFADLLVHAQEEYRFTSKGGIIRLLRADVAQALPPPPESSVGNALDSVGSAFGHLFGVKPDSVISADVKVGPVTQAVLDFRDAVREIGYDSLALTATRGADRTIRLTEITLTAPEEQLTGTGQIANAKGVALFARPLSLELQLAARGHPADLLAKAGLLSGPKDPKSFALLPTPVRFGGTLGLIDPTAWRDLLVQAAKPKPPAAKPPAKSAPAAPRS